MKDKYEVTFIAPRHYRVGYPAIVAVSKEPTINDPSYGLRVYYNLKPKPHYQYTGTGEDYDSWHEEGITEETYNALVKQAKLNNDK